MNLVRALVRPRLPPASTVDLDHLAAYNRVCGFALRDTVPPTYPHVMAFPLTMRLVTADDFPFPLVGLVHLANRITVSRPVPLSARWEFSARAGDPRPHDRGRVLDVVTVGTVDGLEVWRGVSTYLHRSSSSSAPAPGRSSPPPASAVWPVPARVGPDYARVSGDRNPIHTSRIGARLLGFRRPIAHGMWSKARCLAAVENRLPDAYTVEVSFKRPLFLPGRVAFTATADSFALHDPRTGAPHVTATFIPPERKE